jgi:hypothetical protein
MVNLWDYGNGFALRKNSDLESKPMRKEKGLVILAVLGILAILGLVFLSLHWMTRQRNLQSHKIYFMEVSRTLAESGLQILLRALRDTGKPPGERELLSLLQNPNFNKKNFYGFFLQDIRKLQTHHSESELTHEQIFDWLEPPYQNLLKNLRQKLPGSSLDFKISFSASPFFPNSAMKDPVEKIVRLNLECTGSYQGTSRKATLSRDLRVYNLLAPLTSKFTFYQKSFAGGTYNRLVTNLYGQPIRNPQGDLKYPDNAYPLILINGPTNPGQGIPTDLELLKGRGGSGPLAFEHLTDPSEIERSREAIIKRGFLFFGPQPQVDTGTVLNLTPGLEPSAFGEYFHLFNINQDGGAHTYPAIQFTNIPNYLEQRLEIINHFPPEEGGSQSLEGKADIYSLYEGFYEPDATTNFAKNPSEAGIIKTGYSAFSSLIHPFGTYLYPSRAYTMGAAFQAIAKISSIGVDRLISDQDEGSQSQCWRSPVPKRDGTALYLYQTPRSGFENPILGITLDPIRRTMANKNFIENCLEPETISLPGDFIYPTLFPDYKSYQTHMSGILTIPLNHILDYPHYTHKVIPPSGHESFKSFMFPPFDKGSLLKLPERFEESWVIQESQLHSKSSIYLEGDINQFEPDQWQLARSFFEFQSFEEMAELGFITDSGSEFHLNGRGHQLFLNGDFRLDKPLRVLDHTNLYVSENCELPPVKTEFYFNLSCNKIALANPKGIHQEAIYRVFLNARSSLSKKDANLAVSILGGIAMHHLEPSVFQAPTVVTYNHVYSPLEAGRDLLYRMALDDHNLSWSLEI